MTYKDRADVFFMKEWKKTSNFLVFLHKPNRNCGKNIRTRNRGDNGDDGKRFSGR